VLLYLVAAALLVRGANRDMPAGTSRWKHPVIKVGKPRRRSQGRMSSLTTAGSRKVRSQGVPVGCMMRGVDSSASRAGSAKPQSFTSVPPFGFVTPGTANGLTSIADPKHHQSRR
jgi:hypothetical protein